MFNWHKKEKPFLGYGGFGGASTGLAFGGAASQSYWFVTLAGSSNDMFYGVALDSSDNIIVGGSTTSEGEGSNDFLLAKYDIDGAIQWQKVAGTSDNDNGYAVDVDSGGEIAIVGRRFSGSAYSDAAFQLFDSGGGASGGGAQYRALIGSGTDQEYFHSVKRNSSNETFLAGSTNAGGSGDRILIAKYDSSNNISFQKKYGGSYEGTNDKGDSLALDSSGNMYVVGTTNNGPSSDNDIVVVKFNSSGVIQWQRGIGKSGNDYGYGICLDSSNNVYVVGETAGTGGNQETAIIIKYNSSGTYQWNRILTGGNQSWFAGVCVDSSDNVYACGRNTSGTQLIIAKYNSSGTIQWQRGFGASGDQEGYSMQCDSNDNLIIAGKTGSSALILKLPNDGSLTGTYGSYTYQSTSFTDGTATLTEAAVSNSVSDAGLTASTVSNTVSTATLTSSTTSL